MSDAGGRTVTSTFAAVIPFPPALATCSSSASSNAAFAAGSSRTVGELAIATAKEPARVEIGELLSVTVVAVFDVIDAVVDGEVDEIVTVAVWTVVGVDTVVVVVVIVPVVVVVVADFAIVVVTVVVKLHFGVYIPSSPTCSA